MIKIYDFLAYRQPAIIRRIKQLFHTKKPRVTKAERLPVRIWVEDGPFDFTAAGGD